MTHILVNFFIKQLLLVGQLFPIASLGISSFRASKSSTKGLRFLKMCLNPLSEPLSMMAAAEMLPTSPDVASTCLYPCQSRSVTHKYEKEIQKWRPQTADQIKSYIFYKILSL